ncbi:molybdopterin synthase [Natronomonas sp.]|uniref:molybdopterin synthase n=1 Tax=Natronomonas sp. TaxID=2184060 RepID=UPI002612D3D5|nr:molybdopterin synthase [Natronomonas sp.]
MYAVSIAGPGADRVAEELAERAEGRVGTVRTEADGEKRRWTETGDRTECVVGGDRSDGERPVRAALDRLAPDHEYAFVSDAPEARLPTVAVGGTREEAAVSVSEPPAFDPASALEAVRDTEPYETLESLVAEVKRSDLAAYSGAIATFTGRVRAKEDEADERTRCLEFEKYDGVAEDRMATIEAELEERAGVLDVRLHHRTGRILDGEDIVFVVVLAAHRGEAFDAVEDGIDRLKEEVPLFKKEVTDDEAFWVHQRE